MFPDRARRPRSEAMASGEKRYFTGEPCKNGHISERYTRTRQCCQCNIERLRKYYDRDRAATRQRWRAQSKQKMARNPDRVRSNVRKALATLRGKMSTEERRQFWREEYYNRDKEKINATKRQRWLIDPAYREKNKERCRQRYMGGADYLHGDILSLLDRQGWRCALCGRGLKNHKYHKDHIMPIALGGPDVLRNIQMTCAKCNLSKGKRHPLEDARRRGRLL